MKSSGEPRVTSVAGSLPEWWGNPEPRERWKTLSDLAGYLDETIHRIRLIRTWGGLGLQGMKQARDAWHNAFLILDHLKPPGRPAWAELPTDSEAAVQTLSNLASWARTARNSNGSAPPAPPMYLGGGLLTLPSGRRWRLEGDEQSLLEILFKHGGAIGKRKLGEEGIQKPSEIIGDLLRNCEELNGWIEAAGSKGKGGYKTTIVDARPKDPLKAP